jgi:hypothetical protein
VNEAKHNAGFSSFASFWVADLLVNDHQGLRRAVWKYSLFADEVNMDLTLIAVDWNHWVEFTDGAFVFVGNGMISVEIADRWRIPANGACMKGGKFDPNRSPSIPQFPPTSRVVTHRYLDLVRGKLSSIFRGHEGFDSFVVRKGLQANSFVQGCHARQALIRIYGACDSSQRQQHQHRVTPPTSVGPIPIRPNPLRGAGDSFSLSPNGDVRNRVEIRPLPSRLKQMPPRQCGHEQTTVTPAFDAVADARAQWPNLTASSILPPWQDVSE